MSSDGKDSGATTWGTQQFETAPSPDQLQKIRAEEAAQKAQTVAPQKQLSVVDVAKTIKVDDFAKVHQLPCARQGLLTGIGGGAAFGALRYILGAPIPKAANWAASAFVVGSIVSYEFCQSQRRAEVEKMKRVVEVYDKKQVEWKQKEEEKKRQRKQKEADEETARLAAQRRWYKFW